MSHDIEPSLFDQLDSFLTEYAEEPAETTFSRARLFAEEFFLQLFTKVLDRPIVGVNAQAKEISTKVRLERTGNENLALRRLLTRFEQLCDLLPTVLGELSGPLDNAPATFTHQYFNQLLVAIVAWADTTKDSLFVERARQAQQAYAAAFS